jgi:HD-GYP domain-containing protein (c-di-GMP phosphodiesterase class II)
VTDEVGKHSAPPPRASIVDSMQGTEGLIRQTGKEFVVAFYTAIRSLKMYPLTNDQTQRAIDELTASAEKVLGVEAELEFKVTGNFVFINGTRMRHDLDSLALFTIVIETLIKHGVGTLNVEEGVTRNEWIRAVELLSEKSRVSSGTDAERNEAFRGRLIEGAVEHISADPPEEGHVERGEEEHSKEIAKRTYERGVAATKDLVGSVRMGKAASVKKVKRAVQGVIDQVLGNETSLMGLTTIRDYDEYTFTHSVNVCTFAVSIGKRLGFTKLQLYDLGMAALLHDLGKSRISLDVLNKAGPLDDHEWAQMKAHPWYGVLALFNLRGYGAIPYRSVIVAFEHHMRVDLKGYPKIKRPREMSLFSKIIAVADGFDAATSRRSYQTTPLQADSVLYEMWQNPGRGMDTVLVKGMINLLGLYPVGTCVRLTTGEIGVVHGVNPNPRRIDRPLVRVIRGEDGEDVVGGNILDLAEIEPDGGYKRAITIVLDPAAHGINPGAHFV